MILIERAEDNSPFRNQFKGMRGLKSLRVGKGGEHIGGSNTLRVF